MLSRQPSSRGTAPLLFRHAQRRVSGTEIPGRYDAVEQLWVVETGPNPLPLVDVGNHAIIGTNTVTKVRQEPDDDDFEAEGALVGYPMAELATKTDVQHESDDQLEAVHALDLATKTLTVQEQDDEDWPARSLLELETKTSAELEKDDDSPMIV